MALEEIRIKITGDASGVQPAIDKANELIGVDKKAQEQFNKSNEEYKKRSEEKKGILAGEIEDLKELQKRRANAHNPTDIKEYNERIAETKARIQQLTSTTQVAGAQMTNYGKTIVQTVRGMSGMIGILGMVANAFGVNQDVIIGLMAAHSMLRTSSRDLSNITQLKTLITQEDTIATEEATVATEGLNTAMEASPLVIVAAAAAALGAIYVSLASDTELSKEATKDFNDEFEALIKTIIKTDEEIQDLKIDIDELTGGLSKRQAEELRITIEGIREKSKVEAEYLYKRDKLIRDAAESEGKWTQKVKGVLNPEGEAQDKIARQKKLYQDVKILDEEYATAASKIDTKVANQKIKLNEKTINEIKKKEEKELKGKKEKKEKIDTSEWDDAMAELQIRWALEKKLKKQLRNAEIESDKDANKDAEKMQDEYWKTTFEQKRINEKDKLLDKKETDKQYLIEIDKINIAELEKQKELGDDSIELEQKIEKAKQKLREDMTKESDKKMKEAIKTQMENIKQFGDFAIKQYELIAKSNDEYYQHQEELTKTNIEVQSKLAAAGKANTLAQEEKAYADLERKRQQDAVKLKKAKELEIFLNAVAGFSKDDPKQAFAKALALFAETKAMEATFAEEGGLLGQINTKSNLSRRHKGGGDILVHAQTGEGILSRDNIAALGGDNAFLKMKAMLDNPMSEVPIPLNGVLFQQNNNKDLVHEIQELKDIIRNKRETIVDWESHATMNTMNVTTIEKGIKETIQHQLRKPKLNS